MKYIKSSTKTTIGIGINFKRREGIKIVYNTLSLQIGDAIAPLDHLLPTTMKNKKKTTKFE